MTAARERARQVAQSYVQGLQEREAAGAAADRASDVWDRLLRDLTQVLERTLEWIPEAQRPAVVAAVHRAEVATGDRDPRLDALVAYLDKHEATLSTAALAEALIGVIEEAEG